MHVQQIDDFRAWLIASAYDSPYYVKGHKFEKTRRGTIMIDRGEFELEEALEIVEMMLSSNPFAHMAANLAIWEKNGMMVKVVLAGTVALLALIIFIVTR